MFENITELTKIKLNLVASKKRGCNTFHMNIIRHFEKKTNLDNSVNVVSFDKKELTSILNIYGKLVSTGEWRDYSISTSLSNAIFSVFRRSSENPVYMIIKTIKPSKPKKTYSIVDMNGQIIKQGKELGSILQIFNKKLFKVI